ncbi:unnamed protein product [Durusdinium trenchii]|uniref:Glycoside hydrolase family 5 domain-containing protein n=1 Tax=Durusdinium trenchii TaxID=1381693 RepID=A0ABP0HM91_9DINO
MDEWRSQFPLRANGCRLVNQRGQLLGLTHFKLAGVNWYGASDSYHVSSQELLQAAQELSRCGIGAGGVRDTFDECLAVDDIIYLDFKELCRSIAAMGFTVVRLPFSSGLEQGEKHQCAIDYNINKDLEGLSPLQVYDRVIDELGAAGVTVVINNHTTVGAWSGGVELNGMWFRNQCEIYTEQSWIDDWVMMAKRYEHQPQVIGYDIRNEVRPTSMMGPSPRWGKTDATYDWSRAAGSCARALMDAAAPGLLVIERIAWPQNSLRAPPSALKMPIEIVSVFLIRIQAGLLRSVFDVVDYVGARALYGEMGQAALETQMDQDFGFCIDEDLCPVWLSELGCSLDSELEWFGKVCKYLERKDVDFAYWPLNVGPKPGSGADDEAYGILTNDWQPRWADPRLQALRRLCPEPLIPSPRKVRRPLQLPRSRADSAGTPSPFHVITPSPDTAAGPLVPWPGEPWSKEMPEARYIWEVLDGIDSDPGKDALTVRCDDLEAVKELCCRQRCGGFALHKGIAYFRLASPEAEQGLLCVEESGCTPEDLWTKCGCGGQPEVNKDIY